LTALVTALVVAGGAAVAPAALAAPLTPARYAGFDSLYQPLEAIDENTKNLGAALAPARQACEKLDASDPLLRAARKQCRPLFLLLAAPNPTCANRSRCRQQFRAVRRLTQAVMVHTRALNKVIASTVATERCRAFLRTDAKTLMQFRRIVTAYKRVEAALAVGSEARLRTALRKLSALPSPGSGPDDDRTFRGECPSA
jgi:hypothetical protein